MSALAEPLGYETKFIFPGEALAPARVIVAAACRPELPFGSSHVETIYFDGRGLESLEEKLASDYHKAKIRLRWYDSAGTVWLEVKRRVGTRREKFRTPLPIDGRELSRRGLEHPDLVRVPELLSAHGENAAADLIAVVHLTYRRERFVAAGSSLRISIDSAIRALEIAPWTERIPGRSQHRPGAGTPFLVEIKGESRDLPPELRALAVLGGRRGSFSKYSFCLLDEFDPGR
ncbi:MAG: VTC domain-containing protein [Thermoanaerobaculia bacterium]